MHDLIQNQPNPATRPFATLGIVYIFVFNNCIFLELLASKWDDLMLVSCNQQKKEECNPT